MTKRVMLGGVLAMVGAVVTAPAAQQAQPAAAQPQAPQATPAAGRSTNLGNDPNGNPLRLALKTNHISNYDESKVGAYSLPDPLVFADGKPVADARAWARRRREILKVYESEIYGRIPEKTPKVTWRVTDTDRAARNGTAIRKRIVGTIGSGPGAPTINLTLHTPAQAKGRVPVILLVNFGGGPPRPAPTAAAPAPAAGQPQAPAPGAATTPPAAQAAAGQPPAAPGAQRGAPPAGGRGPGFPSDPPVADEILARGWGYATVGYLDIQPDRANAWMEGVIGRTLHHSQSQPAPGEWGTIGAWSWGVSRIVDYLEKDSSVDAKRIALQGHSRLGKTVLWASALDERIAAVFSSCSGEMGAALARRDWGETVDDMAQNFPWQFGGRFPQWAGRWNEMPVDAHMLIALSAPRPVFVTGGTTDQWADPVGMFKALVAAGPVYKVLGKKDLGISELPALDTPVVDGDLGWHYHTGGHMATPADWKAFLQFLGKYFG